MGIPSDIAEAAKAAGPLGQGSAEETLAKPCYDSEYGFGPPTEKPCCPIFPLTTQNTGTCRRKRTCTRGADRKAAGWAF
jgi:hypothetical protein